MGRGSALSERVTRLEGDVLASLTATFESWKLGFTATHTSGLASRIEQLRARVESLVQTTGDQELQSLAVTSFDEGVARRHVSPEGKSLLTGLLWQLLRGQEGQAAASISAAGASAWRDNPWATEWAACAGCGFVVPAKPGKYDYQLRRSLPPVPCVAQCPECGGVRHGRNLRGMREVLFVFAVVIAFALFSECNEDKCVPEDEYDICDEEREDRQF